MYALEGSAADQAYLMLFMLHGEKEVSADLQPVQPDHIQWGLFGSL